MNFEEWFKKEFNTDDFDWRNDAVAELAWDASAREHKPKWISVNDRLPNDQKWYVCKLKKMECPVVTIWLGKRFIREDVTHWLELTM